MTAPDRDRARWGLEFRDVVFHSALCPEHKMLLLAIMSFMSAQSCSSYPNLDTLQRRSSLSRTKPRVLHSGSHRPSRQSEHANS